MRIENENIHNKKVIDQVVTYLDVFGIRPTRPMNLHQYTGNALVETISKREVYKMILKPRTKELQDSLDSGPFSMTPLAIQAPPQ